MRKVLYCLLYIVLFMGLPVKASRPIRQWFVAMPDSLMPLLTQNNRLDCIDFMDCGMEAVVTNRMDGKSRMAVLTDAYLHVGYTASTDVTMRLLPLNDSTDVLCMVTTVKAPVKDSRICFYDEGWRLLEVGSFLTKPELADFRPTGTGEEERPSWEKLGVLFATYYLSADTTALECRLTSVDYLSKDDREALHLTELPCIKYVWEDGKFRKDE